jgi:CRISPR-associated endonuclease/helicase Cas3
MTRRGWRGEPERLQVLPYPDTPLSGVVLTTGGLATVTDDDDTASCTRPVALTQHLDGVGAWARRFAAQCGLSATLVADVSLAGRLHDLGKSDHRFQCMLHGGEELAALSAPELLGKSGLDPTHRAAFRRAWRRSALPRGWRHEFFSVALIASNTAVWEQAHDADVVRYLVGVHHGLGRPFPPAVVDRDPQESTVRYRDWTFTARSDHGLERLDSGWAELFWRLVRRYGYWGLAYLEALLRMADRARSREEMADA